jgi:hypothetical protein
MHKRSMKCCHYNLAYLVTVVIYKCKIFIKLVPGQFEVVKAMSRGPQVEAFKIAKI